MPGWSTSPGADLSGDDDAVDGRPQFGRVALKIQVGQVLAGSFGFALLDDDASGELAAADGEIAVHEFDCAAGDSDLSVVDGQLRLHELFAGLANVVFGFDQVLVGDGARIAELACAAILILGGFHLGLRRGGFRKRGGRWRGRTPPRPATARPGLSVGRR